MKQKKQHAHTTPKKHTQKAKTHTQITKLNIKNINKQNKMITTKTNKKLLNIIKEQTQKNNEKTAHKHNTNMIKIINKYTNDKENNNTTLIKNSIYKKQKMTNKTKQEN